MARAELLLLQSFIAVQIRFQLFQISRHHKILREIAVGKDLAHIAEIAGKLQ